MHLFGNKQGSLHGFLSTFPGSNNAVEMSSKPVIRMTAIPQNEQNFKLSLTFRLQTLHLADLLLLIMETAFENKSRYLI